MITVRAATAVDHEVLATLYNQYVANSPATFDVEPVTAAKFERYTGGRHRLLVAQGDDVIVGYASSGPWRVRRAYDTTVELSVYLAPGAGGNGIGTALYAQLIEELRAEDVEMLIAGVTLPNPASERLHERFGFRQVGVLTRIGRKFDQYWDVALFERPLR